VLGALRHHFVACSVAAVARGHVLARWTALRAGGVERVAQDGRQQVGGVCELRTHRRRRRRYGGRLPRRRRLDRARVVHEHPRAVAVLGEGVLGIGEEPAVVREVDEHRVLIDRWREGAHPRAAPALRGRRRPQAALASGQDAVRSPTSPRSRYPAPPHSGAKARQLSDARAPLGTLKPHSVASQENSAPAARRRRRNDAQRTTSTPEAIR
jgi:hypothetical protein